MTEQNFTDKEIEFVRKAALGILTSNAISGLGMGAVAAQTVIEMEEQQLADIMGQLIKAGVPSVGLPTAVATTVAQTVKREYANMQPQKIESPDEQNNLPEKVVEELKDRTLTAMKVGKIPLYTAGLGGAVLAVTDAVSGMVKDDENEQGFVDGVVDFVENASDKAVDLVNKGVDYVQEQGSKGYEYAKKGIQKGYESMKDNIQDGYEHIKDGVQDSCEVIGNCFKNLITENNTLENSAQKIDVETLEKETFIRDNSTGRV